jgi:hypothetical protein
MATSSIALLDTDVLIDIFRQHPTAQAWLQQEPSRSIKIPGIVAMEIIGGSRNKLEMKQNHHFVSQFSIVWHTPAEFKMAYRLLMDYRLATGIGLPDCLIAAMALEKNWQLYSFNLKHYRHISNLNVQIPYQR